MTSLAAQESQPMTIPGADGTMMRALLLDDNPIDRKQIRWLCTKAGLHLDFAEAGNLADMRRHLDAEVFDIVFIDYHLGMETGLEALRMLLAHEDQGQAIPIMVTSFARHAASISNFKTNPKPVGARRPNWLFYRPIKEISI